MFLTERAHEKESWLEPVAATKKQKAKKQKKKPNVVLLFPFLFFFCAKLGLAWSVKANLGWVFF